MSVQFFFSNAYPYITGSLWTEFTFLDFSVSFCKDVAKADY